MRFLSNNTMMLTERALDAAWAKQRVIGENIANIETPGYRAKFASFELELKNRRRDYASLDSRDLRKAIEGSQIAMYQRNGEVKIDGNNVDAESEQTELARVQFEYQTLINFINHQFSQLGAVMRR